MKRKVPYIGLLMFVFSVLLCMTGCSCITCEGTGMINCNQCLDQRCDKCLSGYIACDECDGIGYSLEICSICDGKGYIINPITWEKFSCETLVEIDCSSCEDGDNKCWTCGGDELIGSCVCNDDRKIPCPDCSDN